MRFAVVVALALAAWPVPQEKAEYELKWGLPPTMVAEYVQSELKGGKPLPGTERAFLLFAADLAADGGNTLLANTYDELPVLFALQLPKGKVKAGHRWTVEKDLFEQASRALTTMHGFRPVTVRGQLQVGKAEKVGDRDCVRIEGQYHVLDLKFDSKGNREPGKAPIAQMSVAAWITLADSVPARFQTSYNGRVSEFDGIKQGEEAKSSKINRSFTYELKKDLLPLDPVKNIDAIHGAIRKGAEWLKKQSNRGTWVDAGGSFAADFPLGSTALAVMALLHSGVKADDPVVRTGMSVLLKGDFKHVYDVAATLMAIETRCLPLEQYEDVKDLTEEKAREAIAKALTREEKDYLQRGTDWLLSKQTKEGTWGYPEESDIKDNSNTQYALLGLKSAARCGVKVPSPVWKKILKYWMDTQKFVTNPKVYLKVTWMNEKDPAFATKAEEEVMQGAWGYFVKKPGQAPEQVPDQGYGSMTCAGLTSIVIAQSELFAQKELDDDLRKRSDSALKAGLAWLQHHYTVRGCPPSAGFWSVFHMYYLYSLERVGVLLQVQEIGGHDWYQEGALMLVRAQRTDGSWKSYDDLPILDTSFALLFLKKATVKVATH